MAIINTKREQQHLRVHTQVGKVHIIGVNYAPSERPISATVWAIVFGPFGRQGTTHLYRYEWDKENNGRITGLKDWNSRLEGEEGEEIDRCFQLGIDKYLQEHPDEIKAMLLQNILFRYEQAAKWPNAQYLIDHLRRATHWTSIYGETINGKSAGEFAALLESAESFQDQLQFAVYGRPDESRKLRRAA